MKSFLQEIFIDPFRDGEIGSYIIGIIIWLFSLVILGLLSLGIIFFSDYMLGSEKQDTGIIIDKRFEPSHTETLYVKVGNITVPQTRRVPDKWYVKIEINDLTDNFYMDENSWNQMSINQEMNCRYTQGGVLSTIYINKIWY